MYEKKELIVKKIPQIPKNENPLNWRYIVQKLKKRWNKNIFHIFSRASSMARVNMLMCPILWFMTKYLQN